MRRCRHALRRLLILVATACAVWAGEVAPAALKPGDRLPELPVGARTYRDVTVKAINARTVLILHRDGMSSIHLRDLAPEWQSRFHYDPAAEAAADRTLKAAIATAPKPAKAARAATRIEGLVRQFGQPVTLFPEVDLRPKFAQLALGVKNQGRRPSCAVFAVISALELQNADATGVPDRFSEEYLIWATQKLLHPLAALPRTDASETAAGALASGGDDADMGFTLGEVVAALRAYGVPPESALPASANRARGALVAPPPELIKAARDLRPIRVFAIPGRDNAARIGNIVHALNNGVPVVIGLAWPGFRALHGGEITTQRPLGGAGHAVTLVGYAAPTGQADDLTFVFKNSWGPEWGQAGYGTVAVRYLARWLGDAVLLEVDAPAGG